jgi:hypothetical protein
MWHSGTMMATIRKLGRMCAAILLWAVLAGELTACPEIGMLGSNMESFQGSDEIRLAQPREDILAISEDVGKSLGYKVSSIDKSSKTIGFAKESAMMSTFLIGRVEYTRFTIHDQGKIIQLHVAARGNFGTGGQQAATALLNQFKEALSRRLAG